MDEWYPRCPAPVGLVRPVRLDPANLTGPSASLARSKRWRRSSHGLVVPSDAPDSVEQRILEQSCRLLEGGMVTGWAALRMAGANFFDGMSRHRRLPVPVLLPHGSRLRAAGVLVERSRGTLPQPLELWGVPCAPAPVALRHELTRCAHPVSAGIMVDMALAAGVVTTDDVDELLGSDRWSPAAAHALRRANAECRSPKESEMLQVWESVLGFPRPLMNREVLDERGRVVAVVDQIEELTGTFGEYNGAAHRSRERQRRDEQRASDLRDLGLGGFVLVAGDSHETWLSRMRAARERALARPVAPRRWSLGRAVLH